MLRFLHAGDFHLDSPFSELSPQQAAGAREQQRELLSHVQELALEKKVDLIFLTGDIFDGQQVYPETLETLQATLSAIPAEVFISPGNHDPYSVKSPYARVSWPSNVHIFKEDRVTAVELPELGCTVYGSAFTESLRLNSPLEGLSVSEEGLQLGCFHGDLGKKLSRYGPISPEELGESGLHYVALGHVHARSELARAGKSFYAYPGCPQGRGFDETGEKGIYFGTIDEDGSVTLEFLPLCLWQYHSITADLGGKAAKVVLKSLLPSEPSGDICRIFLRGERREGTLPMEALYALAEPYYHTLVLIDETREPEDLWAREREEGLCGLFLREMRRQMEAAKEEERETLLLAARFGLAALEGREEPQ